MKTINRRDFVKASGLAIGGLIFFPSCLPEDRLHRFFSPEEANCLMACCEQIIPADDFPGATDAGVIHYIDRQLAGVFHYHQITYRKGIEKLQSYSTNNFHHNFEDLDFQLQTSILENLEGNRLSDEQWPGGEQGEFFNLIRNHTMQGFYGSPIHGGNKDYMSFDMLGIEYPLVIGQNRYNS